MDKYEYKVKADEIKDLILQGYYQQAAEIADSIDWHRVKSVKMLCTISDLYKINRRYEDARDLLLLAYDRRPGGRTICYSLCELSIKTEDILQAVEYYKEFVSVAPKDSARYILQYKIFEAQNVSMEERIEVLEELKKRDYREKWAYELAYLYHRIGLATRCVEECDELVLWFGEGKYVMKALELKQIHQPLSPAQKTIYDNCLRYAQSNPYEQDAFSEDFNEADEEIVGGTTQRYSIARLPREELSDAMEASMEDSMEFSDEEYDENWSQEPELDIHVKTMDMGRYNTINLQEELAAGLREVLAEDDRGVINNPITRSIMKPMMVNTEPLKTAMPLEAAFQPELLQTGEIKSEVFFGETGELIGAQAAAREELLGGAAGLGEAAEKPYAARVHSELTVRRSADMTAETVMRQMRQESLAKTAKQAMAAQPPREMASVLSQEPDGQISLVMPDKPHVEKQITGQLRIDDILAEWERMKQENVEKSKEEVRRHVLEQTGDMFTEFEASIRDGLLEKLEKDEGIERDINEKNDAELDELEREIAELEKEMASEPREEVAGAEALVEPELAIAGGMEDSDGEGGSEDSAESAVGEDDAEESAESAEDLDGEDGSEEGVESVGSKADSEKSAESADSKADSEKSAESASGKADSEKGVESASSTTNSEKDAESADGGADLATSAGKTIEQDKAKIRNLTEEERELFAPYIQDKQAQERLIHVLDNVSLAAYTGNVIITGGEGTDTLTLARNIAKELQQADSNFSGKMAKISGKALNGKSMSELVGKLANGALIILRASDMEAATAAALYQSLQQEQHGIVVILEDNKHNMDKLLERNQELRSSFTNRMDVEELSNDALVSYGKQYARSLEYAIDTMGVLSLHTRIEELQTLDHAANVVDVRNIVDEAISHARKGTPGHFFDILLGKRYDDEDMIILGEKDFNRKER